MVVEEAVTVAVAARVTFSSTSRSRCSKRVRESSTSLKMTKRSSSGCWHILRSLRNVRIDRQKRGSESSGSEPISGEAVVIPRSDCSRCSRSR